ncbi:DCTD deaminase [Balamuthia mandrillaris]
MEEEVAAPSGSGASMGDRVERPSKRLDYLSWDDYFMAVAFLSAERSKDPHTQVGACIVNKEKKIVGIGYNGFPWGCSDDVLPWTKQSSLPEGASPLDSKAPYVCHAEMNAILNKNDSKLKGCSIYVALFPCNECAKLIIQSRIREVIYYSDKYHHKWPYQAGRKMLELAGIVIRQFIPAKKQLVIDFEKINTHAQPQSGDDATTESSRP